MGKLPTPSAGIPWGTDPPELEGDAKPRPEAQTAADPERKNEVPHQSEERFRFLVQMVPSMLWIAKPDGRMIYVNGRMREFYGSKLEADSRDWVRLLVHPDDCQRCAPIWRRSVQDGSSYEAEIRCIRSDNVYRWCITRAVPQKDASGQVLAWFGVTTDVHDLKLAQQQLLAADHKKDEFLAILAHELRNPLAPICNSLYLLRTFCGLPLAAASIVDIIDRQVARIVRLVDDLLEVSRIARGRIELRRQRLDLATILRTAVETSLPLIEAAHHTLKMEISDEPLILDGDPVRLEQAISNLLNNAAKYTEEEGQIWLSAKREENEAVVSVRDNGLGISKEMLPRIFTMFTQAEGAASRSQGGLGIGLTLARGLIQLHDGRIEARSEGPGKGSEFIVRLPLEKEGASMIQDSSKEVLQPAKSVGLASHRILIVDDNQAAADSLAMLLQHLGAKTCVAYDGYAALREVKSYQPSVILLDLGMPGLDGYAVAEELRRDVKSRDIVLIAVSGWGREEDRRRTQAAGFDHHLIKPVSATVLQALLAILPTSRI